MITAGSAAILVPAPAPERCERTFALSRTVSLTLVLDCLERGSAARQYIHAGLHTAGTRLMYVVSAMDDADVRDPDLLVYRWATTLTPDIDGVANPRFQPAIQIDHVRFDLSLRTQALNREREAEIEAWLRAARMACGCTR